MTIKSRNRLYLAFSIFASSVLIFELIFFIFYLATGRFNINSLPDTFFDRIGLFIFRTNPVFAFAGIFALLVYTTSVSIIILNTFEKTQAPDIMFFMIFLIACISDSFRIFIPLFNLPLSYSHLLIIIGNTTLFAEILAPLSLLGMNTLCSEEHRKDLDKNCLIIVIASLFITNFMSLTTSKILPNFGVSYGYKNTIETTTFLIMLANIFTIAVKCAKNELSQMMTAGFAAMSIGYTVLFHCSNLFACCIGFLLSMTGTLVFLFQIHKQYNWND